MKQLQALPYVLSAFVLLSPVFAQAQTPPTPPQPPGPGMMGPRGMGMGMGGPGMHGGMRGFRNGIPPQLAQKLGISPELQKKVQQLTFDANEQLIGLKAELQRQQLELQKLLTADKPNQSTVMAQLDRVTRAEGDVRKNRIGLMLKIREALGPELWQKLQAEMPQRRMMKRQFQGGPFGGLVDEELEEELIVSQ